MSLTDALLLDPLGPPRMDVWIALRTDGAKGSGTEDDPYDGSTRIEVALPVSSITSSGNEATVTTGVAHGYANNEVTEVSGASNALYNGRFPVYSVTSNTFKYRMKGTPGGSATGSMSSARVTYRFDQIMASIPVSQPVGVHLGPGTFETRGYGPGAVIWMPRSGMKIRGSGIDVTTLKLAQAYRSTVDCPFHAIGCEDFLEAFEASDFTVDCALADQPIPQNQLADFQFAQIACGAINVPGKYVRVRRIRAINFGTQTGETECFVIGIASSHPNFQQRDPSEIPVDCVVEECIVEQPALNNARETTCIITFASEMVHGSDGRMSYHEGCTVRNCLVDGEYKDRPIKIVSISRNLAVATVTTAQPHGRSANEWVRISGALVNSSTNNNFNGSFKVSAIGLTSTQFQYTIINSGPNAPDGGDIWLGRWPSHYVPLAAVPSRDSVSGVVTVQTATPHFLAEDGRVSINGITKADSQPSGFNGYFTVTEVTDHKTFKYHLPSNPDTPIGAGAATVGVNFQAVSIDGGSQAVMEGCTILNCGYGGPYHDTFSSKSLIVRNNRFRAVLTGPYQYMGGAGARIPIKSGGQITHNGEVATFEIKHTSPTVVPHGFTVGQGIRVLGAIPDAYNGFFAIESVLSETQFTYRMATDPQAPANVGTGEVTALWQVGHCVIEGNIVELMPHFNDWGPPTGIGFSGAYQNVGFAPFPIFREVVIRNNVIRYLDNLTETGPTNQGIAVSASENVVIENNIIDLAAANPIAVTTDCKNIKVFNNRRSTGESILTAGRLTQADGSVVRRDEIAVVIEDAVTLALL